MKTLIACLFTIAAACAAPESPPPSTTSTAAPAQHHAGPEAFTQADTDKNGKLSLAELQAAPAPGPLIAQHLPELDQDGDGELTHDEIMGGMGQLSPEERAARHQQLFTQADTDKNGKLSRAELEVAPPPALMMLAHFDEIDADHDGELGDDEIKAAMAHHHGQH